MKTTFLAPRVFVEYPFAFQDVVVLLCFFFVLFIISFLFVFAFLLIILCCLSL